MKEALLPLFVGYSRREPVVEFLKRVNCHPEGELR
jgi:hypothetical protein